ncbi:uncharacterized protein LOC143414989 [Maylandia zebra]|uniref:uncharacterized protein LOC143414989 n=1 Tax=Maylandia zebra TaxID=106582 RepID=UPI00403CDD33
MPHRDRMIPPRMDPAVSEERLRREVMDRVYRLCELWWEKLVEGLRRAVERRLQETLFKFPWLVDDLNPVVLDFLLSTLHPYSPPQAAHRPGQLVDSQPETPAPTSTRKRRSRRRRSSPQPHPWTSQEPAVVSSTDNFPFPSPSVFVSAVDELTTQVTSPWSDVATPPAASPSAAVPPPPFHLPAATILISFSLPAAEPCEPEQELGEPEELSVLEEPAPPAEELSELEEPAPPAEELSELVELSEPEGLSEPEEPAPPAEGLSEPEPEQFGVPEELSEPVEPALPPEELGGPERPAQPELEVGKSDGSSRLARPPRQLRPARQRPARQRPACHRPCTIPRRCSPELRHRHWIRGRPPGEQRRRRRTRDRLPEGQQRRHRHWIPGRLPGEQRRRRWTRGRPPEEQQRRHRHWIPGRPPGEQRRRYWTRDSPPEGQQCRRHWSCGRPPELFCCCCRTRGRPPERQCRRLWTRGRPPELFCYVDGPPETVLWRFFFLLLRCWMRGRSLGL